MKSYLFFVLIAIVLVTSGSSSCTSNTNAFEKYSPENYRSYSKVLMIAQKDACYQESKNFGVCINGIEVAMETNQDFSINGDSVEDFVDGLDAVLFKSIWKISEGKHRSERFGKMNPALFLNYNSEYLEYLQAFSEDLPWLKEYLDTHEEVGGISPSMFALIYGKQASLNLDDPNTKLIVLIHYITSSYVKSL